MYVRLTRPDISSYEQAATNVQSQGKRIAGQTSDFNKGATVQLEAANKVQGIMDKASQMSSEHISKLRDYQNQLKAKYGEARTNVEDYNRAQMVGAQKGIADINARALAAKQKSLDVFLRELNMNKEMRQRGQYKIATSQASSNYSDALKTLQTKYGVSPTGEVDVTKSQQYKDFERFSKDSDYKGKWEKGNKLYDEAMANVEKSIASYKAEQEGLTKQYGKESESLYSKYAMPNKILPFFAKGGSLEDKVRLENVKASNKMDLEELKQYYKRISDDVKNFNQLMKKDSKSYKPVEFKPWNIISKGK